jgi:hypothetical protein
MSGRVYQIDAWVDGGRSIDQISTNVSFGPPGQAGEEGE